MFRSPKNSHQITCTCFRECNCKIEFYNLCISCYYSTHITSTFTRIKCIISSTCKSSFILTRYKGSQNWRISFKKSHSFKHKHENYTEELSYLLRIPQRKPYGTMESNVKKALKIAVDEKETILASVPADQKEKGLEIYTSLTDGKGGLQTLLNFIKDKDPDRVSVALASSLDSIAQLELLQAPGLSFLLPAQYTNYPRLTGRAVVEFVIEKGDGSMFTPQSGGVPRKSATVQIVLDGYSAPLTTGNFAKLVVDGAYNEMKLKTTDQAILSDNGIDKSIGYSVPLEIMPSGQFEPLYKTTLSIQDGELPVLPLSVYGAVAMAHDDVSEEYSSPNQFFFYLYDKSYSGLGGLSFDEGQFSVFGYTTTGRDILPQIKSGDIVRSAKLVEGQDNLVLPAEKA